MNSRAAEPDDSRSAQAARADSGPVVFAMRPEFSAEEIAQMQRYVATCNEAKRQGALSKTGRVRTKGDLRRRASRAAAAERRRAERDGTPYKGQVGHAPDTTWTGRPVGFEWHDQTGLVNSHLGGQNSRYPIGYQPTEFRLATDPQVGESGQPQETDPAVVVALATAPGHSPAVNQAATNQATEPVAATSSNRALSSRRTKAARRSDRTGRGR